MSENAENSNSTRNVLIGAAVAVVVAAFAGYQVGFGNGESGLKEVQDKLGQLEETAKAQAGKVEEQAATLTSQASELEARATEVKTQTEQIEKLTSEVAAKAAEVDVFGGKLSAAKAELADVKKENSSLSARLSEAEQQSENYLATIMADMRKQLLLLHVGGMQETLIENTAAVGLSFVSRPDKSARVTLSGEQLELKLQEPENIRIEGRACALTLVNLISDTDAMLELSCSG